MTRSAAISAHSPDGRPAWVERVAARIARRRGPQTGDVLLSQRSIYILPSRAGLLYGTVVMTMLVASINYKLSLGYALTFLLAATALVGMLHTFRNLSRLLLRPGRVEPVFAGQIAEFSLVLSNRGRLARYAIRLNAPGMAKDEVIDLAPNAERIASVALATRRRGWLELPRLTLRSRFPLGIWTTWAYWHPAMRVLVYPTPEAPPAPLPEQRTQTGRGQGRGTGQEDVAGIRPYQPGDPLRRIAWKAVARTGSDQLLTKHLEGGEQGDLQLDWYALPALLDPEGRLSRLTRWVLDADACGAKYAVRLPGVDLPADCGPEHLQRCLEALALATV